MVFKVFIKPFEIAQGSENKNLTLFFPMFPFDPPENIRKPLVFCFQGDQKGTLGRKGLSKQVYFPVFATSFAISIFSCNQRKK